MMDAVDRASPKVSSIRQRYLQRLHLRCLFLSPTPPKDIFAMIAPPPIESPAAPISSTLLPSGPALLATDQVPTWPRVSQAILAGRTTLKDMATDIYGQEAVRDGFPALSRLIDRVLQKHRRRGHLVWTPKNGWEVTPLGLENLGMAQDT